MARGYTCVAHERTQMWISYPHGKNERQKISPGDGLAAEDTKSSKTAFFENAQIGSSLDRVPGRPVHTNSHNNDPWAPLGDRVMNDFQ